MNKLEWYIARSVILSALGALLILLVLVSLITLIDELKAVGQGDYDTLDAIFYTILVIPRRIYEIFPISVLLGSLIGLGSLASHSELIAMRSAGVSTMSIVMAALKAGLIMMVFVLVVGELVAPNTEQFAETMRAERISKQITLQSKYGFWARDGKSFVNIREILPGARLKKIYVYEFSDTGHLEAATYAGYAHYEDGRWLLSDIRQSTFSDKGVRSIRMEKAEWSSMLDPEILNVVVVQPSMLSMVGLYRYLQFMKENGQSSTVYEVAFWSKLVMPLVTLVMVFLAVPFVFGMLRSVTAGQRIFVGSMIGIGFFLLNRVLGHMAVVYDLNAALAVTLPPLIVLGISLWFFRRIF